MWPNPQVTADLATFIEEILNGKLHFLCSEISERLTSIAEVMVRKLKGRDQNIAPLSHFLPR